MKVEKSHIISHEVQLYDESLFHGGETLFDFN